FVSTLLVIPFHTLRIQERSTQYVTLTIARLVASVSLRLGLVVLLDVGLAGVVIAEFMVTVLTAAAVAPWLVRQMRPVFSRAILAEAMHFGLPRVPHGLAQIVIWLSSR